MEDRTMYPWEAVAGAAQAEPGPEPPAETNQENPALQPPAAPSLLTVHALGGDRVTMRWSPVPMADGYTLMRSENGGVLQPLTALVETAYLDTGLKPGSTYTYAVYSYNMSSHSTGAASASVTLPAAKNILPGAKSLHDTAPSPLQPSPGQASPAVQPAPEAYTSLGIPQPVLSVRAMPFGTRLIALDWQPSPGAQGYRLYRSLTPWSGYSLCAETTETRHLDAVDAPETRYYYFVQAMADGKPSAPSPMAEAVTLPTLPEPQQPQHLRATVAGRDAIELRWDLAIGAAAYLVCARCNPGEEFAPIGSTPEPFFIHRDLPPDSWTEYCVQGYHDSGVSQPSLIVSARVPRSAAPSRPARTQNNAPPPQNAGVSMPRFPALSLNALRGFGMNN